MTFRRKHGSKGIWIIFLTSLAWSGAQSSSGDMAASQIRVAAQKAAIGDLSGARSLAMAVVTSYPDSSDGWYELGSVLGQAADFRGAEIAFQHALRIDPRMSKAHFGLALTMIADPQDKQDWLGAIAECRQALKYQPAYVEALNLLGTGLTTTGQGTEAITVLKNAIELNPAFAEAHFNLAMAYEQADRPNDALTEYAAAIAAKPEYPEAISSYGKLLLRDGRAPDARTEFERALFLNPDLADAHYNLARVLRLEKDDARAKVEFAEADELASRRSRGMQSAQLSNRGLELAAKGERVEAMDLLRKGISLKPDYGVPHFNLGLVLASAGEMGEARKELEKAISLMPLEYKTWLNLGRVSIRLNDFDGSYHALAWAAHLSPADPAVKAELASLRATDSKRFDVLESETGPRRPDIGAALETAQSHYEFAIQLKENGDLEGAEGELLRSLSIAPRMLVARRSLGETFEKLNQNERALLEYYKLLLSDDRDASAHLAIGRILVANGETNEALAHLRKAVEYSPSSAPAREALEDAQRRARTQ
jgi:tetratricopeptide (TPR) repeat protein